MQNQFSSTIPISLDVNVSAVGDELFTLYMAN